MNEKNYPENCIICITLHTESKSISMNLFHSFRYSLILLFLLVSFSINAYEEATTGDRTLVLSRKDHQAMPDRPRVPELQYVRCFLDDGMLLLDMEVAEGICELYAEPVGGPAVSTFFDSTDLCGFVWVGEEYHTT